MLMLIMETVSNITLTVFISIHLMLMLILILFCLIQRLQNFNTSHVNVNLITEIKKGQRKRISIHLMLMLIALAQIMLYY